MVDKLLSLADSNYRDFHSALMPTVDKNRILGVSVPKLKKLAKQLDFDQKQQFINSLPHYYYEENNLHAFIIGDEKDYDICIKRVEEFLPYIDNWATCDCFNVDLLKLRPNDTLKKVTEWINSGKTFSIRFGVVTLMKYFLTCEYVDKAIAIVKDIVSNDYYVNMARAWFFATTAIKYYDKVLKVLSSGTLDKFTHNKTISKARDSFRISAINKAYLKTLIKK